MASTRQSANSAQAPFRPSGLSLIKREFSTGTWQQAEMFMPTNITHYRFHRFAALKILDANASKTTNELIILQHLASASPAMGTKHVTELLDHFEHHGPNGVHLCLVFEAMGPSANTMVEELPCFNPARFGMKIRYPLWMAKSILRQALEALTFLHKNGICHGDFQPGNILFKIKDLSTVSENALQQDSTFKYGATSPPIKRLDGKVDKWAPSYLAVGQPLASYVDLNREFTVKLSDFGGGKWIPETSVCHCSF
jgi:serine/threonine protein kinase